MTTIEVNIVGRKGNTLSTEQAIASTEDLFHFQEELGMILELYGEKVTSIPPRSS